jgi:hypothetical protein
VDCRKTTNFSENSVSDNGDLHFQIIMVYLTMLSVSYTTEYRVLQYYFCCYSQWGETVTRGTAATTGLLYQPQMIDDGDCGALGSMKIK